MIKNYLTSDSLRCYADGRAQNSITAVIRAPVRLGDFFISNYVGSARNILNNSACLLSRFELPTPHGLRELLKKGITDMKKTIIKTTESTVQSLYRYYCEMRDTWYKGDYTIEQENIYGAVFNALDDAIMKLPPQCEKDKQIKYIEKFKEKYSYIWEDEEPRQYLTVIKGGDDAIN